MTQAALVVDRAGLARKLGDRPKSFVLYELIQNAWDENVFHVNVTAEWFPKGVVGLRVEDDSPDGFADLASVYTLFRDSKKGDNPQKRGRFELGEKLIAALAQRMEVTTTRGTIIIEGDSRYRSRKRTKVGSVIQVFLRMTRQEFRELCDGAASLIQPAGISTRFNGEELPRREVLAEFVTTLPTVMANGEGVLVQRSRKTTVRVYAQRSGETPMLYEMGIPVVPIEGDPWHYDIQQRIPVNFERNNVPPAYLKTLRVEALNALHGRIPSGEAAQPWVTDALDDARCAPEAVKAVVQHRFGDKAVIYDPSDTEGTKIAVSRGYTVVHGGSLPAGAWSNIREHGVLLPAGQVTPSPRVYDPNGHPERVIPISEWTKAMDRRATFSMGLFKRLNHLDGALAPRLAVMFVNEPDVSWAANFGPWGDLYRLCLNVGRLGASWCELPNRAPAVLDLLLHEFVHQHVKDHLSHEMHERATRLGALLTNIALDEPEFFR